MVWSLGLSPEGCGSRALMQTGIPGLLDAESGWDFCHGLTVTASQDRRGRSRGGGHWACCEQLGLSPPITAVPGPEYPLGSGYSPPLPKANTGPRNGLLGFQVKAFAGGQARFGWRQGG